MTPSSLIPLPGYLEREIGAVHRYVHLLQEVTQRPHVVLMAMGDHHALHILGAFHHPRPVGENQIHPQHVGLRKHQAAVDQTDLSLHFQSRAIAADLSQAPRKVMRTLTLRPMRPRRL